MRSNFQDIWCKPSGQDWVGRIPPGRSNTLPDQTQTLCALGKELQKNPQLTNEKRFQIAIRYRFSIDWYSQFGELRPRKGRAEKSKLWGRRVECWRNRRTEKAKKKCLHTFVFVTPTRKDSQTTSKLIVDLLLIPMFSVCINHVKLIKAWFENVRAVFLNI